LSALYFSLSAETVFKKTMY